MRSQYRYWTQTTFPELTAEWFVKYSSGRGDPQQAFEDWTRFIASHRQPSNEAKFRKALELAVGVTAGAVNHYLFRQRNPFPSKERNLGPRTNRDLDIVSEALGRKPDVPASISVVAPQRGIRRIALLAELAGVPSPRFHLTVLAGIVRAGERNRNFSVALHEVRQSEPDLDGHVARIVRNGLPHGVVWFRLTPDALCLKAISAYSATLPVVLVHASTLKYPPPVIAHVVPRQEPIRSGVEMWARSLPELPNKRNAVVIAAMRPDAPQVSPFEPWGPSVPVSIREERVALIMSGIAASGLDPVLEPVEDYSASQAYDLLQRHRDARGYVCLSDEIAVAVKQLLTAQGEDSQHRILGFDGSELAQRHRIPSFNQWLTDLGEKVIEPFETWFRHPPAHWPPCRELGVESSLVPE